MILPTAYMAASQDAKPRMSRTFEVRVACGRARRLWFPA